MTPKEKAERYECELWVEEYFGLPPMTKEDRKITTYDFQLVNLCAMVKDKVIKKYVEAAFVAGRSKTSWKQFKKDMEL